MRPFLIGLFTIFVLTLTAKAEPPLTIEKGAISVTKNSSFVNQTIVAGGNNVLLASYVTCVNHVEDFLARTLELFISVNNKATGEEVPAGALISSVTMMRNDTVLGTQIPGSQPKHLFAPIPQLISRNSCVEFRFLADIRAYSNDQSYLVTTQLKKNALQGVGDASMSSITGPAKKIDGQERTVIAHGSILVQNLVVETGRTDAFLVALHEPMTLDSITYHIACSTSDVVWFFVSTPELQNIDNPPMGFGFAAPVVDQQAVTVFFMFPPHSVTLDEEVSEVYASFFADAQCTAELSMVRAIGMTSGVLVQFGSAPQP